MTTSLTLPSQVITLDMDATLEDPWHCCGGTLSRLHKPGCLHLRQDILAKVRNVQAVYPEAALVVLSYRIGKWDMDRTVKFLAATGIEVERIFLPGSPDTLDLFGGLDLKNHKVAGFGQVAHKFRVALALIAQGVEVVTSFDDSKEVIAALRGLGIPAQQAPYLVEVSSAQKARGHLEPPSAADQARAAQWDVGTFSEPWQEDLADSLRYKPRKTYRQTSLLEGLRERQAVETPLISHERHFGDHPCQTCGRTVTLRSAFARQRMGMGKFVFWCSEDCLLNDQDALDMDDYEVLADPGWTPPTEELEEEERA